ncbi:unnamed protein product [Staurois parvus]|uniref:Uncharacterized protein n=1 Tax=Staurois parvus TaxID=386267 RepID=A0ABN9DRQ2_9NEOB|nr:unnamed protein product [Staurois parvus]
MVADQGRVAIHKRRPPFWTVRAPWESAAPRSGARCVLQTQWNTDRRTGTSVRGPDHVITDWPIRDHMKSSKQDVTSDNIAYYL